MKRYLVCLILLISSFFFIKEVKALEWNQLDLVSSIRVNSNSNVYGSIYIDKATDTYYLRSTLNSDTNFNYKIENASNYPYILCATDNSNTNSTPNSGNASTTQIRCFFTNQPLKYVWFADLGGNSNDRRLVNDELDNHYYLTRFNITADNAAIFNNYSLAKPQNVKIGNGLTKTLTVYGTQLYRNSIILSNYNIYFYDRDELYQSKNLDFTLSEPEINYTITDGTEVGKKVTINFNNFKATDKIIVKNFYTGKEDSYLYAAIAAMNHKIIYDNLNVDTIFQVDAYTEDDEFIMTKNIDVSLELIDQLKDRYIRVFYNSLRNIYVGNFYNFKNSDKCYYNINDDETNEINCEDQFIFEEKDLNKNGFFELKIEDSKNNIVAKKIINFYFNENTPKIYFNSYFNDQEAKQVLDIIIDNLNNSDLIYYSYDKETWTPLENKRINSLDFYANTDIYVKVERNNTIVSQAYFNVIYKGYENSEYSDDNNGFLGLIKTFTNFLGSITTEPLNRGKQVFQYLFNSKFGLYLIFILISSIFLIVLRALKR